MVTLNSARTPEGLRLYAIGDVHGCLETLRGVHAEIEADLAARPVADWRVIHVGDYVDRGPDNRGVIDYLISKTGTDPRMICLRGNHDAMFLAGIDGNAQLTQVWLANGGEETLADYGVGIDQFVDRFRDGVPTLPEVPEAHIAFLRSLDLMVRFGDYVFVHAGIEPDVALDSQSAQTLLWIREPFLTSVQEFDAVIVHGHTPRPKVEVRANRIGIDTGAVYGNPLTCLVLEGSQRALLNGPWLQSLDF